MLSNDNVRKINSLIAKELREADRFVNSDEEKLAAIQRVAELKKLLSPQPTRDAIRQELSALLHEATAPTPKPSATIAELLAQMLTR